MKILIVEDDPSIRNVLRIGLSNDRYIVDEASDGESGSYLARINQYDLIILDYMLPKKLGKQVCEEIRGSGISTPILFLSAKNEVFTKIGMLNIGADDYLTKPFSYEELKARIRALSRRPSRIIDKILIQGNIKINKDSMEVTVDNKKVYMTQKEYLLLELLMENAGRVISRATMLEKVWDMAVDPFSNTVETHIRNLRKKIKDYKHRQIQNLPGRGYKMAIIEPI